MFTKPKAFFTKKENDTLLSTVRRCEAKTSGEIRIYIEAKCSYVNPMHRAQELFSKYKMYETENRNAVLIYIAHKHHEFAIVGDKNIFMQAPKAFWSSEAINLAKAFSSKKYVEGLINCIQNTGQLLFDLFPYHGENKNELPDEIIFGKK